MRMLAPGPSVWLMCLVGCVAGQRGLAAPVPKSGPPKLPSASSLHAPASKAQHRPAGHVRVVGHCLADDHGPFLGLGISYFSALWRCKYDHARLQSDLAFLSRQGFGYIRILSMVGWFSAWQGREIAPATYTNRNGRLVEGWPDYWEQLRQLIDLAYDRFGLRTQITVFADAQLMPRREDRIEHLRRMLTEVVAGREHKIILLEVANEGWQNGFAGEPGTADLREFAGYLADRTSVLVAVTSNHQAAFEATYAHSAADIATWHFSRDRQTDDGWKPVYDCWTLGDLPGFPPVSSNEPIGPGASVATERSPIRLVMAASFAWAARLPMYVFHCEAGTFGRTRFEDTPAIRNFRRLFAILPPDLATWKRNAANDSGSPFTVFAGGRPNQTWPEAPASPDGCVRMAVSRKGACFVCVPIGIRPGGLTVEARVAVSFRAYDPLTGAMLASATLRAGQRRTLPAGPGGLIVVGTVRESTGD